MQTSKGAFRNCTALWGREICVKVDGIEFWLEVGIRLSMLKCSQEKLRHSVLLLELPLL